MLERQLVFCCVENRSKNAQSAKCRAAVIAEPSSLSRPAGRVSGALSEHTVNYYQTAPCPSRVEFSADSATWPIGRDIQQFHSNRGGHSPVASVIMAPAVRSVGTP